MDEIPGHMELAVATERSRTMSAASSSWDDFCIVRARRHLPGFVKPSARLLRLTSPTFASLVRPCFCNFDPGRRQHATENTSLERSAPYPATYTTGLSSGVNPPWPVASFKYPKTNLSCPWSTKGQV